MKQQNEAEDLQVYRALRSAFSLPEHRRNALYTRILQGSGTKARPRLRLKLAAPALGVLLLAFGIRFAIPKEPEKYQGSGTESRMVVTVVTAEQSESTGTETGGSAEKTAPSAESRTRTQTTASETSSETSSTESAGTTAGTAGTETQTAPAPQTPVQTEPAVTKQAVLTDPPAVPETPEMPDTPETKDTETRTETETDAPEKGARLSVQSVTAEPGETVSLLLMLENSVSFSGAQLQFKLTANDAGAPLPEVGLGETVLSAGGEPVFNSIDGEILLVFGGAANTEATPGVFARFTVTVPQSAAPGTVYTLDAEKLLLVQLPDFREVPVFLRAGEITVS